MYSLENEDFFLAEDVETQLKKLESRPESHRKIKDILKEKPIIFPYPLKDYSYGFFQLIQNSCELAYVLDKNNIPYLYWAESLFQGKDFYVSPTKYEIEKNILILENRLFPFINKDFLLDNSFCIETEEKILEIIPYDCSVENIEEIQDFFEQRIYYQEFDFYSKKEEEQMVEFIVLDMFDFYRKHKIKHGDKLLLNILNREKNHLKLSPLKNENLMQLNKKMNAIENKILDCTEEIFRAENYYKEPQQLFLDVIAKLTHEGETLDIFPSWPDCFLNQRRFQLIRFPNAFFISPLSRSKSDEYRSYLQKKNEVLAFASSDIDYFAFKYQSVLDSFTLVLIVIVAASKELLSKKNPKQDRKYALQLLQKYFPTKISKKEKNFILKNIEEELEAWRSVCNNIHYENAPCFEKLIALKERIHSIYYQILNDHEKDLETSKFWNLVSLYKNLELLIEDTSMQNFEEKLLESLYQEMAHFTEQVLFQLIEIKKG